MGIKYFKFIAGKKVIDWKSIPISMIEEYCINTHQRYGSYPSIRDIFYAFVGVLWTNTNSSYGYLSRTFLKEARLNYISDNYQENARFKGVIDWHLMRDGSGRALNIYWDYRDPPEQSPEEIFKAAYEEYKESREEAYNIYIDDMEEAAGATERAKAELEEDIKTLKERAETATERMEEEAEEDYEQTKEETTDQFRDCYEQYNLPERYKQPYKVAILCEKEADFPYVTSLLRDKHLDIGFMRGQISIQLLLKIEERFEQYPHATPVLLNDRRL